MKRINDAWLSFWFAPTSTAPLAIVRIFFGAVCFVWALSLIPNLPGLLSDDGVVPDRLYAGNGVWTIFDINDGDVVLYGALVVLLAAAACLTVGYHTRIASAIVFVGLISFQRRNLAAFAGGDVLMRTMAFYLMLAPAGAAISVDRWRRSRARFWEFPQRAPWALRLMQIQLSVVYLSTVWDKVQGTTWNNGTAVSYALRLEDLARFPVPDFLAESLLTSNLLTYGTLLVELSIGVLVWNRVMRPYVLGAGLMLHLGIEYQLRVGFFLPAILTGYLAFTPPDKAEALFLAVRDRLAARQGRRARAAPAPAGTA